MLIKRQARHEREKQKIMRDIKERAEHSSMNAAPAI